MSEFFRGKKTERWGDPEGVAKVGSSTFFGAPFRKFIIVDSV